jgi:hypothetical protein
MERMILGFETDELLGLLCMLLALLIAVCTVVEG